MNTAVTINELVDNMPPIIRHEELAHTWEALAGSLGLEPYLGMPMIISVPRDLTLKQNELLDSSWGGAWEWNLSDGLTKGAVISVLIAAALTAAGAGTGIAPVLIPTIVPFLFDVKRVRVERTADNYLRIIGARAEFEGRAGTVDSLYDSLPAEIKEDISKLDFEGFLHQAVDAGRAILDQEVFEILPNGEVAFRVTIR